MNDLRAASTDDLREIPTAQRRYLSCAETAKLVRAALREAFPRTKFSVRSSTYANGASIDVRWVDGPIAEAVAPVAERFQGADFDGMVDLKTHRDSRLDGELVSFGADYVQTHREISPGLRGEIEGAIAEQTGRPYDPSGDYDDVVVRWRGGHFHARWGSDLYYRLASATPGKTDERRENEVARAAAPPAVDVAKIGGGSTWHIVDEQIVDGDPGVVKALCGRSGAPGEREDAVDANVVRYRGSAVCADCRTTYDAGGKPEKENDMTTTTTEKKAAPKARAPKATAPKAGDRAKASEKAISSGDLTKAVARAEKAIGSQPARAEAKLSAARAEKAHKLGKSIAADRWLLKRAKAGKTSAVTVAAMVERIERRVEERNEIRRG